MRLELKKVLFKKRSITMQRSFIQRYYYVWLTVLERQLIRLSKKSFSFTYSFYSTREAPMMSTCPIHLLLLLLLFLFLDLSIQLAVRVKTTHGVFENWLRPFPGSLERGLEEVWRGTA